MRTVKLFVLLILSMSLGTANVWALAEDEVWQPDEPFFVEHMEACLLEEREYYANGPNGQVVIYESPASSKVIKTLKNGETIWIDYTFTNDVGVTWGFCELEGKFGWLPMPYMVVVYDHISFEEEYGDQFQIESDYISKGDGSWEFYAEYVKWV